MKCERLHLLQSADSGRFANHPFSIAVDPDPVLPEVHGDHAARRHQIYILVGRALQSVLSDLYTAGCLRSTLPLSPNLLYLWQRVDLTALQVALGLVWPVTISSCTAHL